MKWPFSKKPPEKEVLENKGLARAKQLGWITEEEFLGLSMDRAEKKYKAFLEKEKAAKKKATKKK